MMSTEPAGAEEAQARRVAAYIHTYACMHVHTYMHTGAEEAGVRRVAALRAIATTEAEVAGWRRIVYDRIAQARLQDDMGSAPIAAPTAADAATASAPPSPPTHTSASTSSGRQLPDALRHAGSVRRLDVSDASELMALGA